MNRFSLPICLQLGISLFLDDDGATAAGFEQADRHGMPLRAGPPKERAAISAHAPFSHPRADVAGFVHRTTSLSTAQVRFSAARGSHDLPAFRIGSASTCDCRHVLPHTLQKLVTKVLIRHFATAEAKRDFNLVTFFEEAAHRAHLHVVSGCRCPPQLYLLDSTVLLLARFGRSSAPGLYLP